MTHNTSNTLYWQHAKIGPCLSFRLLLLRCTFSHCIIYQCIPILQFNLNMQARMASDKTANNGPASNPQDSEPVRKATVDDLGFGEHLEIYTRALANVMSTDVAQSTSAQIVDGAPLSEILSLMPGRPELTRPVYQHSELCDGVRGKTAQLLDISNLRILQYDFHVSQSLTIHQKRGLIRNSQLVSRYLAASPGSKAFKTALIELMTVSVHQIAAYIYNLDLDMGSRKKLAKEDSKIPTFLLHSQYKDIDQYPDGVADAVGYWAEAQMFGGVILFDRRQQYEFSKNVSFSGYLCPTLPSLIL